MNRTEQAEAAAVLKALTKDWALVDDAPEIDFLIFVSESREELDFYPKKSFVRMMERSGLIENLDIEGSSERQLYTSYESDGSVWKEITQFAPIVFQYRLTPKGLKFLREAPGRIGKPIRPLRVATSPVDIPRKPLKVVTYDRQAIQKLVDAFVQKARAQIETLFSADNDSFISRFVCGPKLWRSLEPQARLNGLRPVGTLIREVHSLTGGQDASTSQVLDDRPISTPDEVRLFRKTLRETHRISTMPTIRLAGKAEAATYPYQEEIADNDFPPPDLSSLSIIFVVEANNSKFLVVIKSVPDADLKHFEPQLSWVELIGSPD